MPYGAGADCGSGAGNKNPPVAVADYQPVEYPDSIDIEPDKDIETWDSMSNLGGRERKALIEDYRSGLRVVGEA